MFKLFDNGKTICSSCFDEQLVVAKGVVDPVAMCPFSSRAPTPTDHANIKQFGKTVCKYKNAPSLPNTQHEHPVPNSNFMMRSGRGTHTATVPGATGYTEGDAPVFPVHDNQTANTEHKFLTDYEREVDQKLDLMGQFATLDDKLALMRVAWYRAFLHYCPYTGTGPREAAAHTAAESMTMILRDHYVNQMGIDPAKVYTRAGLVAASPAPAKTLKSSAKYDRSVGFTKVKLSPKKERQRKVKRRKQAAALNSVLKAGQVTYVGSKASKTVTLTAAEKAKLLKRIAALKK
jgi:hypothetical protein